MKPIKLSEHKAALEKKRQENREKFEWATPSFDALNQAFGPLKVIEMIDEDGISCRWAFILASHDLNPHP